MNKRGNIYNVLQADENTNRFQYVQVIILFSIKFIAQSEYPTPPSFI